MKTAIEIQLDAIADAYDELKCEFQGVRSSLHNILHLLESGRQNNEIAVYVEKVCNQVDEVTDNEGDA